MSRISFFVHFNKFNQLSDHVIYTLTEMRKTFEKVVFITNSAVSADDQAKLEKLGLIDLFIQRENKGFDFAAWHDGMKAIGFDQLEKFDSVSLMNDTCFGPLYDMEPIYKVYEDKGTNIWGITNHRAYQESRKHYFQEHIQSYYKVFSQEVVKSQVFKEFWGNIISYKKVQEVIDNYEIQSTTVFLDAGFTSETILDTRELDASHLRHPDFSYYAPDVILQNKVPFIKIKAFQSPDNDGIGYYMLDYIEQHSDYPTDLIVNHLSKVDYPDSNFLIPRKMLTTAPTVEINQSVAVHLHVYYPDLLEGFLEAFKSFNFKYDLFLTTNTDEKEQIIKEILAKHQVEAELVRTQNRGRDIVPFLSLKDQLLKYDVVGHFHTKRSLEAAFFAGESWRTELIKMLITPADNIMANFQSNLNLGIVIADIPTFFRFNKIVDPDNENKQIAPIMNDVWKRMKMNKKVNFHDFKTFTMSYGTFFWAKTEILKPLFNLEIMDREIPAEPLPQNTILHAIERMMIYLAWDKNMDFRISPNHSNLSPFIDARTLDQRFHITNENADDIRLRYIIRLMFKKSIRLVKYRIYIILGKNTDEL